MKIRSITTFINPSWPLQADVLQSAGDFISQALLAYAQAGFEVQTTRLAVPPFPILLREAGAQPAAEAGSQLVELAQTLEKSAALVGYAYVSLGPALPESLSDYALIPAALAATQNAFFSGLMTIPGGISLPAVRACAQVIHRAAPLSADGFANLRFAALANVPAGSPFFPAAYHAGKSPAFALATEAADLAVQAFSGTGSLEAARLELVTSIEAHACRLCTVGEALAARTGFRFGGIDFSLAPFPDQAHSIGEAIERLGVPAVGLHGSLAAAAILAHALDQANFPRAGFSGLFLPVLEDSVLAARAEEGMLTVKDLLLYSAVCGTGLDTLPLPGDTSPQALEAVLLDLAVLAQRLDKPLTARLMPVPGKSAGEQTGFNFAFFANSRILSVDAQPLRSFFSSDETFSIQPRQRR